MPRNLILLLACTYFYSMPLFSAPILSCKSATGKTIFTDDARKCGSQKATELHPDISEATRVNYRYPERQYDKVESPWPIFIERPEKESDKKIYAKAVHRLEKTLDLVFSNFPQQSHQDLKTVTYYIMRGPKSSLGGEDSVLRYAPHNSTKRYSLHDHRWNNAVIIYNVDNYLWLTDVWNNKTIAHELSHAWHFLKWGYQHQPIMDAWLNSRSSGLYLSVKDNEGRTLKPAYASTNNMEYFAELSAIYFTGGVYHPFNKQGLKTNDPTGYAMVQQHWLITDGDASEKLAQQ